MVTELDTLEEEVSQEVAKAGGSHQSSSMDAVYAFGLIGAWIFYIGRATSLGEGVLGVLKGFIWPVIVVRGLLELLSEE